VEEASWNVTLSDWQKHSTWLSWRLLMTTNATTSQEPRQDETKDIFFARKLQQDILLSVSERCIYTHTNTRWTVFPVILSGVNRHTVILFHQQFHQYIHLYHLLCCCSNMACSQLFAECRPIRASRLCHETNSHKCRQTDRQTDRHKTVC